MPFLVWDSPQGRVVRELDRALLVIGRDPACDFPLPDSTVSRRHALVRVEGGAVKLTDLGSTTGTKVNGARLARDLPSTLEPGDFVQVGRVVLSFHTVAPPAATPPPARRPRPVTAPRAAAAPATAWRRAGIAAAFVAVAAAGVLLAVFAGRDRPEPAPAAAMPERRVPPEAPATEPPPPAEEPQPERHPEPPPAEPRPVHAPQGELPPAAFAPAAEFPDLLEIDGATHAPARIFSLAESRVEALGADGRLYAVPAGRVTKIEDRGDLARRVAVQRRRIGPDDVAPRVQLAAWCHSRHLRDEARQLVREALALRPDDADARALLQRLDREGRE